MSYGDPARPRREGLRVPATDFRLTLKKIDYSAGNITVWLLLEAAKGAHTADCITRRTGSFFLALPRLKLSSASKTLNWIIQQLIFDKT
jgi:hypothetical protein